MLDLCGVLETVVFLQALTLEAGALTVLQGIALGFLGTLAVFVLVVTLERRLPHKKMLIATGLLITWVLAVMVGTTVQTLQVVGWIPVSPITGLQLPYWTGLWLGLYPTWQGVVAQAGAITIILGSYVGAEALRRHRRLGSISHWKAAPRLARNSPEPPHPVPLLSEDESRSPEAPPAALSTGVPRRRSSI